MITEVRDHLKQAGYLKPDDHADNRNLATAVRDHLLISPVTHADEIQEKGKTTTEIRFAILGTTGDDDIDVLLDHIVAPLTVPRGLVQDSLENGAVLCAGPTTRRLTNEQGITEIVKKRVRFVSEDPDVIQAYFLSPMGDRLHSQMKTLKAVWDLAELRQPALAARRAAALTQAHQQIQAELPVAAGATTP